MYTVTEALIHAIKQSFKKYVIIKDKLNSNKVKFSAKSYREEKIIFVYVCCMYVCIFIEPIPM